MALRVLRAVRYWLTATSVAWQRRLVAYLLVVAGFGMTLHLIDRNAQADVHREERASAQRLYDDCVARRDGREVLRAVVMVTSSGPVDYAQFPSFARLDQEVQDFLVEVSSTSGGGPSFRQRALEKIPPIECPPPPP